VPSALLARIAARSQPTPVAEPEPEPEAKSAPEAVTSPEPGPVAPAPVVTAALEPVAGPERPAPWASAVPAPVAPWASTESPTTVTNEPDPATVGAPDTVEATVEAAVEARDTVAAPAPVEDPAIAEPEPAGAAPDVSVEPPNIEATPPVAPTAEVGRLGAPWVASADLAPEATHEHEAIPSAVLDSPYEPAAITAASVAPVRPAVAPVAPAPDAAEGELWALVGTSEPTAKPAPASEVTRVILTILTAFLVIVILIGSLVLASQIA
jgi:hypothetical protein